MRAPAALLLLVAAAHVGACGQKGPPLPPLVRVPGAPGEFSASRRGSSVDLQFVVPAANSDGTRPANIARVEVYALTGPATVTNDELLKQGTLVASLSVKTPRDPDKVVQPGEPGDDLDPLVGSGLEQGATARVREDVSALPAPAAGAEALRHYIGVSVTARGRRGLLTKRITVPLGPPPPAPPQPEVAYDETRVTVSWRPASGGGSSQAGSRTYHVYEVLPEGASARDREVRLTTSAIEGQSFVDQRIEWDATRCYAVAAVESREGLAAESDIGPSSCVKMVDTFPPAAPLGLTPVASDAAISLTWDPSPEQDIRGYVVLRATGAGGTLSAVTPAPIEETSFTDTVAGGVAYVYAVQAVDKAGNASAASARVEAVAH